MHPQKFVVCLWFILPSVVVCYLVGNSNLLSSTRFDVSIAVGCCAMTSSFGGPNYIHLQGAWGTKSGHRYRSGMRRSRDQVGYNASSENSWIFNGKLSFSLTIRPINILLIYRLFPKYIYVYFVSVKWINYFQFTEKANGLSETFHYDSLPFRFV